MYLHIGNDVIVNSKNIVGIFDIENTTVSRLGKNFLGEAQRRSEVIYATEELPKSYIIVRKNKKNTIYISSMSTQVLMRRSLEDDVIKTK